MKFKTVLLFLLLSLFFEAKNVQAAVIPQEKTFVQPSVIVSATIGIPKMSLWGYGPPFSVVELSGIGVEQNTTAGSDGYYSFDLIFLPNSPSFPELCITAIDQENRVTPPTCIPEISAGNYFYRVGPVILPPTISLDTAQASPEEQASTWGQTIPNSNVQVVLSRPEFEQGILGFSIVRRALAYYLPSYNVISDAEGNFSFNMPANDGATWRVFTIAEFPDGGKSPKSNTLKLTNLTSSAYFLQKSVEFIKSLFTWPRILILEILLIIILVLVVFAIIRKKNKQSKKIKLQENKQKVSNIVEEYQRFLNSKKVN